MMLLHILITASSHQISRRRGIGVTYEFVKRSTITQVESGINFCADILGTSNKSDELQDNCLKNNHPISVLLPMLYDVQLRYES